MAKVKGPLMSLEARGSLANKITFRNSTGRNIVSLKSQPTGSPSSAQTTQRALYADGVVYWNALPEPDKQAWADIGRSNGISGYSAFMSDWLLGGGPPPLAPTTWNPADKSAYNTLSNGDLTTAVLTGFQPGGVRSVGGITTGKYYFEYLIEAVSNGGTLVGFGTAGFDLDSALGDTVGGLGYRDIDGAVFVDGTNHSYGAAYTVDDVIGIALDMGAATYQFYKNGVGQGQAALPWAGPVHAAFSVGSFGNTPGQLTANFGQSEMAYGPPSGYSPLLPG
jgi:hypothetical protein